MKAINPCKCGSKKELNHDSDDMVNSWMIQCFDCGQKHHDFNWTRDGAIEEWNKHNSSKSLKKKFKTKRLTNGRGESHLVVIIEKAIPDIHIGTVLIIPTAEGFKDPHKVLLKVKKDGSIKTSNTKFAVVYKRFYKH